MRSYADKWTGDEDAILHKLAGRGKTPKQIAIFLDRSYRAVVTRIYHLGIKRKLLAKVEPTTAAVRKLQIVEWYLLGWRFIEFDDDGLCKLLWSHRGAPQYPPIKTLVAA